MTRFTFVLVIFFFNTVDAENMKISDDIFAKKIPFQINVSCQIIDKSLPKNKKVNGTNSKVINHSLSRANDPRHIYTKGDTEIHITVPVSTIQYEIDQKPLITTSQYALQFKKNGKVAFQVSASFGDKMNFDYWEKKVSIYCSSI